MRIKFFCKITGCISLEEIANLIKTPEVGFDELGNAYCEGDQNLLTWTTCWSHFTYHIQPHGNEKEFEVVYQGSLKGFLSQNLIPPFVEVRIEEMEGKLGSVHSMCGKENAIYKRFHAPAIEKLRRYIQSLLPERAAESLMSLSSEKIGEDLLIDAGLVNISIGGWAWWSTCCMTTVYRGWVTKEVAQEWEEVKTLMKEENKKLPDIKGREASQKRLWDWIGVV
jgi:hypothetical protein